MKDAEIDETAGKRDGGGCRDRGGREDDENQPFRDWPPAHPGRVREHVFPKLTFADGISSAGRYVEMRAEMDVTVLISNCPQLNNPCNAYDPTPVEIIVFPKGMD